MSSVSPAPPGINTSERRPRGKSAAIGDVRLWNLRNSGGATVSQCWMIKTASGWMQQAAFIWLQHHGSIPEGYEVAHIRIVDPPDDSLSNLQLVPQGSIATKIQICATSKASLRRKKRLRGIAKANRQRASINRAIEIRPDWWYPVILEPYDSSSDDHSIKAAERGTIFMNPQRSRVACWRRYGFAGLSVIKGLDLLTLEEHASHRREVMEEIEGEELDLE